MVNEPPDRPNMGRIADGVHRYPVRVHYEDTDFSGVVYHANYLNFLERARSDLLRVLGIDQRAAHEAGTGGYAVSSLSIRYLRPARFDDALVVVTKPRRLARVVFDIQQRVIRADETLAEADVTLAFVSPSGRPVRQPAAWTEIFAATFPIDASMGESPA